LAIGTSDGTVQFLDPVKRERQKAIRTGGGQISDLRFAVDGTVVVARDENGKIFLLEPATGTIQAQLAHPRNVFAVALDPDSTVLATAASDGSIRVWEAASGRQLNSVAGRRGSATLIAVSRGGRYVAGTQDETNLLWEP
jgi:WD40 repeat protein